MLILGGPIDVPNMGVNGPTEHVIDREVDPKA